MEKKKILILFAGLFVLVLLYVLLFGVCSINVEKTDKEYSVGDNIYYLKGVYFSVYKFGGILSDSNAHLFILTNGNWREISFFSSEKFLPSGCIDVNNQFLGHIPKTNPLIIFPGIQFDSIGFAGICATNKDEKNFNIDSYPNGIEGTYKLRYSNAEISFDIN